MPSEWLDFIFGLAIGWHEPETANDKHFFKTELNWIEFYSNLGRIIYGTGWRHRQMVQKYVLESHMRIERSVSVSREMWRLSSMELNPFIRKVEKFCFAVFIVAKARENIVMN